MVALAPGTQLQLMYLKERLRLLPKGRFLEVGPGSGEITQLLLDMGWQGQSYDLEESTVSNLQQRFSIAIEAGRFEAVNADIVSAPLPAATIDLVISCMVMEHMTEREVSAFMRQATHVLAPGGRMISLVPASPHHWGIEDDIAGHMRRYTRASIQHLITQSGWRLVHMSGLTFPLSNVLLPLSNYLVERSEKNKLALSKKERTKLSGRRKVAFKTHFPAYTAVLLNRITLWPFHQLQKIFRSSSSALVLYFEATPDSVDLKKTH